MFEATITGPSEQDLDRMAEEIEDALADALTVAGEQVARLVHGEAKRELQSEVYNVPIPLLASAERVVAARGAIRPSGRFDGPLTGKALERERAKTTHGRYGRWERTGALKRAESYEVTRALAGALVRIRLYNNQGYAKARHDLGTPGHPRAGVQSGNSPTRSVQWHEAAVARCRPRIERLFRTAIAQALGRVS